MASITNIASSDLISNSREDINNNFTNLNNDKIETSVLDTDTSLTANSDTKIATQKAVRAYVDASVNPTGRSWNEYAVDAVGTDAYGITVAGFTDYTAGQTFKFKAGTANTGACSLNVNAVGAKTIKKDVSSDLVTGDILANQIVEVIYDGTNFQLISRSSLSVVKFGGTGADGSLSISSGTTTVDLAGARLAILNYSSISITGTGKLAFSNPHANGTIIVIKCAGNCTITATAPAIDCSGLGGDAGGGGSRSTGPANTPGGDGTDGQTYGYFKTNKGVAASGGAVSTLAMTLFGGGAGTNFIGMQIIAKYPHLFLGAGGNGGRATVTSGSGTTTGGNGGRGGGCLIMEIAGTMNFTTTNGISVAGQNGSNGVIASAGTCNAGGGGGGGGGFCYILYNVLTAFSGTVNVSGGVGGNCLNAGGGDGDGGSGGGSLTNAGAGPGNSSTNGVKTGGDGGAGLAVNEINTEFT